MRTFIALELPDEFIDDTAALARQLKSTVEGRYMQPDTYHVTLAFLGELDERGIAIAIDAMGKALDGMRAARLAPDGLGKFGRANDATLWLGLQRNDGIMQLAEAVREELLEHGIQFDAKTFKPHITIARRANIPKGGLPALPFPQEVTANRVTLFKSTLSSEGAEYDEIHSVALDEPQDQDAA